ncbi:helix-turn-helix domain-containing protein [Sporocytophaga myxococcoides]|uniref:helix-turn-helix domain-containing protein n=1 Tax=Sporocytophaga myxococcoides TaxID=153721 RepID=UPI00041F1B70|nr:helix-turn-helix transcriptional regulator [Sporocytophaga myxococcoides]
MVQQRNPKKPTNANIFGKYFIYMIYFGENLYLLRKEKGLNQAELSEIIGVGRNTLSDYENGKSEPNLSTLIKISEFFGINIHTLLVEALNNVHSIKETENGKKVEKNQLNDSRNQGNTNSGGSEKTEESKSGNDDLIAALRMVIETQKNLIESLNSHNSILQERLSEVEQRNSITNKK